ncbi:MAG: AAA family ATPase, partial [Methanobacteriota archaeon]
RHQGQYPVIYLTLKQIKGSTFPEVEIQLRKLVSQMYDGHCSIAEILKTEIRKDDFDALRQGNSTIATLKSSLKELISTLYEYYQKPVIVLIDEYDSPLIEAWTHGYYDEMADFMRTWLGGGLKHENGRALSRAVVTGILRVAKESIFSELNNLDVASPLMIGPYSDKFGFTQPEVDLILEGFDIYGHADIIRDWYNGYSYGGQTIYNPWSVISYIQAIPNPPGPKWLNTSSNALVYEELAAGGLEIKRDLEILLAGGEIRYPIPDTITFQDIGRNPINIWSFLYYSGYLKADDPQWAEYDPDLLTYTLTIPNREIGLAYRQFVNRMYETGERTKGIKGFLAFFLENQSLSFLEETLQDLTLGLVSMYDLAKLPEAVFHAFVLGLLANLRYVYEIRSNPEAGYGRADILMVPKTRKYQTAYVIEFKSTPQRADDQETADVALKQIRRKEYEAALKNAGVTPDITRRLAIILQGKKIEVRSDDDVT